MTIARSITRASTARPQPEVAGASDMLGTFVVTEDDGSELKPVPAAFVAVTVNVYAVFWVRHVIVTEVIAVVAVTPPGSEVTVYSVIGLPPSEAGAVHETTTRMSPGVADTVAIIKLVTNSVGAPGTVGVVTEFDASEVALVPMEFVATTVKVYAVPFVRPVTTEVRPGSRPPSPL